MNTYKNQVKLSVSFIENKNKICGKLNEKNKP